MELNVVMTLDDSDYSRADDGKWNDVAESTLHHTVCEYTNDYVKGSDCKLLYYYNLYAIIKPKIAIDIKAIHWILLKLNFIHTIQ